MGEYYHGDISPDEVTTLFLGEPEGSFLVRDSSTIKDGYVLCLKYKAIHQYRILRNKEDRLFIQTSGRQHLTFNSLDDLVRTYIVHGDYNGLAGKLLYPILKSSEKEERLYGIPESDDKSLDLFKWTRNGDENLLLSYLEAEGDPEILIDDKRSVPLHIACKNGWAYSAHLLIKFGADINQRSKKQWTPLHHCARHGHVRCIEMLLEVGADINMVNQKLDTPLHLASVSGHRSSVRVLLGFGAKLDNKNSLGYTAKDLNIQYCDSNCIDLFKDENQRRTKYKAEGLLASLEESGQHSAERFRSMMEEGWYESYDARYLLVGEFGVGKTTLAKLLVGDEIDVERHPTDGIAVTINKSFIDLDVHKWSCDDKDLRSDDMIYQRLLSSSRTFNTSISNPKSQKQKPKPKRGGTQYGSLPRRKSPKQNTTTTGNAKIDIVYRTANEVTRKLEICDKTFDSGTSCSHSQTGAPVFQTDSLEMNSNQALLEKTREAFERLRYRFNRAPIYVWDFGGQNIFNATHQMFLTYRGIYILVINGSRELDAPASYSLPARYGKPTNRKYIKFWVSTILAFCRQKAPGFPRIVMVATFKDLIPDDEIKPHKRKLFHGIQEMFRGTDAEHHLVLISELFFDVRNMTDVEIARLRQVLVEQAECQPSWGERMPKKFLKLELQLSRLLKEGETIISFNHLKSQNEAMTEDEIELFLRVQHALGKLLYFPVPILRGYVMLAPEFLIDVCRSVITDREFCKNNTERLAIWQNMDEEGILRKTDVDKVWESKEFSKFNKHRTFLLRLLQHLDFIVEPKDYVEGRSLDHNFYLVPSMISKRSTSSFWPIENLSTKSIGFAFVFDQKFLPTGTAYRFITCCISIWTISRHCGKRKIASGLVIFVVDRAHELVLQCEDDRILIFLVHEEHNSLIDPDLARSLFENVNDILKNICDLYSVSCKIDQAMDIKHKISLHYSCCIFPSPCYISVDDAERLDSNWICDKHQTKIYKKILTYWTTSKAQNEWPCADQCTGIENPDFLKQKPTGYHLCQLADSLEIQKVRECVIHLGLSSTEIDAVEYSCHHQADPLKLHWLLQWKTKNQGTFKDLKNALEANGCDLHILCKLHRRKSFNIRLKTSALQRQPTEEDIDRIAEYITFKSLHVALYLGLTVERWENIKYAYPRNLIELNKSVLETWINMSKCKPTLGKLALALDWVGKNPSFMFRGDDFV